MTALDLLVRLLAAARLTRLVTVDELGEHWVYDRAESWLSSQDTTTEDQDQFLLRGLECPHCVGFWITAATLAAPNIRPVKWILQALAASYVVGHLSAKIDS